MIGDRLYRFLIPGCVFLLAFVLLLALYPGISVIGFLKTVPGNSPTIFGGGIVLVVAGYAISEVVMLKLEGWIVSKKNAEAADQNAEAVRGECSGSKGGWIGKIIGRIGKIIRWIGSEKGCIDCRRKKWIDVECIEGMCGALELEVSDKTPLLQLTGVYNHGLLEQIAPGFHNHLQRSWSHILISCHCIGALISAGIAFFLVRLLPFFWAITRPSMTIAWVDPYDIEEPKLWVPFFICILIYAVFAGAGCWVLWKRVEWEVKYHFNLYKIACASNLGRTCRDADPALPLKWVEFSGKHYEEPKPAEPPSPKIQ